MSDFCKGVCSSSYSVSVDSFFTSYIILHMEVGTLFCQVHVHLHMH